MGDFKNLIQSGKPVLVDFHAEWCGPCKAMAPELVKLANRLNGKAKIIKVDVDKNQAAAIQYQIMGVPTLIIFKDGQIKWRQSGMMSAPELENIILKHLT